MPTDSSAPGSITIPDVLHGSWTSLVVLTYGANLGFFESRLLGQISQIPLRVVLADGVSLRERLVEAANTGQRLRANRTYIAGPIHHPRAAHAKAILLADGVKGMLLVGSGNLGQDGYASPGELWHAFAYDDARREHLNEFVTVRNLIDGLSSRDALDTPTTEILREVWSRSPWLGESAQESSSVRHNLDVPLAEQLAGEVRWKVESMTAYAPFHDSECSALASLIERFKPRQLRVLIRGDTSVDADHLSAVLAAVPNAKCMHVAITEDPTTYLHAKWIHLVGAKEEVLLSGSANLSRPALLNSADSGNVELGRISRGRRGEFDYLYAPLSLEDIENPHTLGVTFKPSTEMHVDISGPQLLWSRLDGIHLTLMFDRPLDLEAGLALVVSDGTIPIAHARVDGCQLIAKISPQDAAKIAESGALEVRIGEEANGCLTWPYHVASLLGRLDRAVSRDILYSAGNLPEGDAELYELLQALESSLIFDPESAWRVAKPQQQLGEVEAGGEQLRWQDLDWDRIQRDPRYRGYQFRSGSPGVPPTEIQVLVAAISGKLGELANIEADLGRALEGSEDESTLSREGESNAAEELDQDDTNDEVSNRSLSIKTRTRMAFNRFVGRYASATRDHDFIEKLGPVIAIYNATIFNSLIRQLLAREIVDPTKALSAQVAAWELIWGTSDQPGLLEQLGSDERQAAERVIEEAGDRSTTLIALSSSVDYAVPADLKVRLRDLAIHLLTDPIFGLDASLVEKTAPEHHQAAALVGNLESLTCQLSESETADYVVGPLGLTHFDSHWGSEEIMRQDPATGKPQKSRCETLIVDRIVDGLDDEAVLSALRRFVVATFLSGHPRNYWRIKFSGNRGDLGYWDAASNIGLSLVGAGDNEFDSLEVAWPDWFRHLKDLSAAVTRSSRQTA